MITGKKNLFLAALEVIAIGIFLKIGYHIGNKLIEKVEKTNPKKKKKSNTPTAEGSGGRRKVVEEITGNKLSLLN